MIVGPVFTRELVTVPRRSRLYVARATYVAGLLLLMCTAWLILTGTQIVRNVGDLARFGTMLFQILAPLQLALGLFFSAIMAASGVAQEKDRRTLVLLLLTNLSNSELVLGKLLASMLTVLVLLASSLPVFVVNSLFGGVSFGQIGRVFLVTLMASLAAGSLGSTLALWREKTFQTLGLTVLTLVAWLAIGEAVARGACGATWFGLPTSQWAVGISPWQATLAAVRPVLASDASLPVVGSPLNLFFLLSAGAAITLNAVAMLLVRVWNPSREMRITAEDNAVAESIWGAEFDLAQPGSGAAPGGLPRSVHAAPGRTRQVWDNPVLWREIGTWAYGRKVLIIRIVYLALSALAAVALAATAPTGDMTLTSGALILVPLFLVSLVLVNAQAVTALTSERDIKALDLLLVTDLTARSSFSASCWACCTTPRKWCCCLWRWPPACGGPSRCRSKICSIYRLDCWRSMPSSLCSGSMPA